MIRVIKILIKFAAEYENEKPVYKFFTNYKLRL